MNRNDLLNLENKKNIKKPLVYGAVAFLVFIIAILGFAIYKNSKEDNVVLPPQMKQTKQEAMFKEVPIEKEKEPIEKEPVEEKLADKLLKEEPKQIQQTQKNLQVQTQQLQTPQQKPKPKEKIKAAKKTKTIKAKKAIIYK